MKKEIIFAFGPNDEYFFSCPPSRRYKGFKSIQEDTIRHLWVSKSPDGWSFQSFVSQDRSVRFWGETNTSTWHDKKVKGGLAEWLAYRQGSARRVVFGTSMSSSVSWTPLGDHRVGPETPKTVVDHCKDATLLYTSIRLVALGVGGTYIIIWEDGTMRWNLKDKYDRLDAVLSTYIAADISFVALNPSKAGDYFIYFATQELAMFQVSEAFGKDLEDILLAHGVRSQAIVRRRTTVAEAPQNLVPKQAKSKDFLQDITTSVGIGANLLSIGTSIAGLAACSVM